MVGNSKYLRKEVKTMTIKEYANLKKSDVVYYITTNEENKKVVGCGKVLRKYAEKYIFNKKSIVLKLIDFSYDTKNEKSQNIFLYHYGNNGYVTEAFYNVYITKEEAKNRLNEINASNKKLTEALPWY